MSKAQAGTLTAEDVDTYKAHLAALVKEAGKAGVASSEALKGAHVSALKFIDTALDSNALAIEHTASQYDELTDAVSRATARSNTHRATLEDVLELLPGNADEWDDFVKIMEQLDGKGNLAAGVMDTLRQKIKDLKAEIAGEQQNYAETLQFNLDTLSNRTWEGLLKLYDQATATRDKTLLNAVMDEMEKRGLEVQKTAQDAWEAFYNPSGKTDYTLPSLIPKQPMSTAEGATTDFSWTAGWMADQSKQKALDDYVLLLDDMSEAELKAAQDAALLAGDREKLDMVTERLIARQKAWVAALKSGPLQTDLPNAGEITIGGFTPGPMSVKPTDDRPDLTPTMKLRAESFLLAAKSADSFTKSLEDLTLAELEAKLATASTDEQFDEIAQKWREVAAALRMPAEEGNSGPLSMEEWRQSVQTLTDQFDAGEISAQDYSEGIKGINADLLGLANAADKAGNPRLAQAYRDMAQQFRELTPEIAAALKQFGKLQQYGEWANQVLGALGKLAQAMSQTEQQYDATGKALNTPWSDLAANIEGAQKAIALAVDMSKDVAKLVASGGADIGAWISLATKVVSAIADALSGFKKAYADAQRLRDDFATSNPYLNAPDFQKVSVQSRGWLADIFVGPKVINEIDKVGVQFANSFAQHVADGFTAGLKKAVMEGDTSQIGKNLRMNTFEGIVDGMIDSFKTEIIKEIMAPFLKEWSAAMKTPDTADDLAALNTLDTLMPRLDQAGEAWANNVVPRLQSIQQKWGLTPDATGGNTGNLFGNAPGVQLGIPQITVSLPETALKPIADLSSTVARLESLLDKGLTLNATNIQISLPDNFLQANALFNSSVSIFAGAVPAFAAGSADLKMVPTEFRTVFAEMLTYMRTNSPSGKLPPLSGNGGLA